MKSKTPVQGCDRFLLPTRHLQADTGPVMRTLTAFADAGEYPTSAAIAGLGQATLRQRLQPERVVFPDQAGKAHAHHMLRGLLGHIQHFIGSMLTTSGG